MDIGQEVHIGIARPAMGDAHHPFHHFFGNSGFDFDLSPIRFNNNGISILNPILFSRFLMDLRKGFRTSLLETSDVSMLGMSKIKDSGSGRKNHGILLIEVCLVQKTLIRRLP